MLALALALAAGLLLASGLDGWRTAGEGARLSLLPTPTVPPTPTPGWWGQVQITITASVSPTATGP